MARAAIPVAAAALLALGGASSQASVTYLGDHSGARDPEDPANRVTLVVSDDGRTIERIELDDLPYSGDFTVSVGTAISDLAFEKDGELLGWCTISTDPFTPGTCYSGYRWVMEGRFDRTGGVTGTIVDELRDTNYGTTALATQNLTWSAQSQGAPPQFPASDSAPPDVSVSAKARQEAGDPVRVRVTSDEDASAVGSGRVVVKKGSRKRTFKLAKTSASLTAGERTVMKLRPATDPTSTLRKIRKLVLRGWKATAKVKVTATDAAGNPGSGSISLALTR